MKWLSKNTWPRLDRIQDQGWLDHKSMMILRKKDQSDLDDFQALAVMITLESNIKLMDEMVNAT